MSTALETRKHAFSPALPERDRHPLHYLELHFSAHSPIRLREVRFTHPRLGMIEHVSRQTGTGDTVGPVARFPWNSAVRALSLLVVRHVIHSRSGLDTYWLTGGGESLAESLSNTLNAEPRWLRDIFGMSGSKNSFAQALFYRSSSNLKRDKKIALSISSALAPDQITIYRGNVRIEGLSGLTAIANELERKGRNENVKAVRTTSANKISRHPSSLTKEELQAGPHVTKQSLPRLPDLMLDEEYHRLWRSGGSEKSVLRNIQKQFGEAIGQRLITLRYHTEVNVLNEQGDARMIVRVVAGNFGTKPIDTNEERFFFERPTISFSASVRSYPNGGNIPWHYEINSPKDKKLILRFPRPVEPLETVAYELEYTANGVFRLDNFWFMRVRPGVIHASLSLRLNERSLSQVRTWIERRDGTFQESILKPIVGMSSNAARADWEIAHPPGHALIKTVWSTGFNGTDTFVDPGQ